MSGIERPDLAADVVDADRRQLCNAFDRRFAFDENDIANIVSRARRRTYGRRVGAAFSAACFVVLVGAVTVTAVGNRAPAVAAERVTTASRTWWVSNAPLSSEMIDPFVVRSAATFQLVSGSTSRCDNQLPTSVTGRIGAGDAFVTLLDAGGPASAFAPWPADGLDGLAETPWPCFDGSFRSGTRTWWKPTSLGDRHLIVAVAVGPEADDTVVAETDAMVSRLLTTEAVASAGGTGAAGLNTVLSAVGLDSWRATTIGGTTIISSFPLTSTDALGRPPTVCGGTAPAGLGSAFAAQPAAAVLTVTPTRNSGAPWPLAGIRDLNGPPVGAVPWPCGDLEGGFARSPMTAAVDLGGVTAQVSWATSTDAPPSLDAALARVADTVAQWFASPGQ